MPDLYLPKPNYSSAAHNSSAFREKFVVYTLSLDGCYCVYNTHKSVAQSRSEQINFKK